MSKKKMWVTLVLATASMATAQVGNTGAKPSGSVARGKYLVNNVGMCGDCHTPFDQKGQPIKAKMLKGAPLMFKPTVPMPAWMPVAPGIAGLNWSEEQAVEFFTTGKRPDGTMAAPPMPQLRLSKSDAAAVYAYLKSLK